MDWLALAVLGCIWAILLVPTPARRNPPSPIRTEMPVEQEDFRQPGRWILSPKRGSRFVGQRQRERERARERRRRVFVFLLEAIGLTGLIGMFPPLRGMLVVTGFFVVLLAVYTVLALRVSGGGRRVTAAQGPATKPDPTGVVVQLAEIQTRPDEALEEQDRRLVRLAR